MDDLNSRDYDVNDIEDDKRLADSKKEAIFTQAFLVPMTILYFVVAYLIYYFYPNSYIAGYPTWFVSGIGFVIIEYIVCIYFCKHIFKDCSLDARIDEEETR